MDASPDAAKTNEAEPSARSSGETTSLRTHEPSSMFLWVLALTAFCLNLGYGIVIPILEELAARCGSGATDEFARITAMAIALISFNVAKVLGEVPGGIFSDRIGDRVILALSLFIYGISVLMLISARSYLPFTSARFIEGLATGVSYPAMTSILLRHSPHAKLGRNMSIGLGAGVAGIIVGPVIAGPLVAIHRSWLELPKDIDRPLWIAFVFTVVVFAFTVGWSWTAAVRSKKGDLSQVPAEVKKAVATESLVVAGPGPSVGASEPRETFLQGIVREFAVIVRFAKSPIFLGLLSPLFFDKMVMCAWQILLFLHVKHIGLSGVDPVGTLMALLALSFAIVTPISGILADRLPSRWLAHGSLVGIVSTLALMVLAPNGLTFYPLWVAYSAFSAMLLTVHLKMVGDVYHEEQQHGRIFGIVHALSDLGMVFGPPFIWLYAWHGKLGVVLTFVIMAGLGFLTIPAFAISHGREKQLPRP